MASIRAAGGKARRGLGKLKRELVPARPEKGAPAADLVADSSVTDRVTYVDFCARAAADDRTFRSFRREPIYVAMLEHVTKEQGADYLRVIRRDSPAFLGKQLKEFRANDQWGSPVTHRYPGIGRISPVTLRYLKVLSDLELLFGDLTGKRIVEIGVGYGGQARLVLERWVVQSYTLVDLEPALRLASRYLTSSGRYGSLIFLPSEQIVEADYDLCVSNYAFSELRRDIQDSYAPALVASASHGYLTCNFTSGVQGIDSWSKDQLSRLHAGAHWIPEEPLTFEGNAILVWGDLAGSGAAPAYPEAVGPLSHLQAQS
jgi:putative sugar O-methyltransferase